MNRDANVLLLYPPRSSYKKVIQLFPNLSKHSIPYEDDNISNLINLKWFCPYILNYRHVHHSGQYYRSLSITNRGLQGWHGFHMVDFYRIFGKGVLDNDDGALNVPVFLDSKTVYEKFKYSHKLEPGKVALIAPYSTGLKDFLPSMAFWERIVNELTNNGYTVFTNCFGKEKPIKGTEKIEIDYDELVPFLDIAGVFIGIRSGLCDIVSSSLCHKIIIHLDDAKWWPYGRSVQYTGLNHMGITKGATFEVTYNNENHYKTVQEILDYLKELDNEHIGIGAQ